MVDVLGTTLPPSALPASAMLPVDSSMRVVWVVLAVVAAVAAAALAQHTRLCTRPRIRVVRSAARGALPRRAA